MEKICWKMGRKDVPENTGCGHPAEPGVHTVFSTYQKRPGCRIYRRSAGFWNKYVKNSILFLIHGRGKRKDRNQRYLELFRRFLERQTIYNWHTASFQGRNNYCKTDPDATFMHMKDDHMRMPS